MRRLETLYNIETINMNEAAAITARGFGRENDEANYADTLAHLDTASLIQALYEDEKLVAFAAYRGELWQARH